MGFEPFVIPKRTPTETTGNAAGSSQSRDEKVRALAVLLHSRGLTSSLTDARRLAEGMVDVEKKIINQTPQTSTGLARDAAAPINNVQNSSHSSTSSAQSVSSKVPGADYKHNWDERFEKFVARTAPIKEEYHRSPVPTPQVASSAVENKKDERKDENVPTHNQINNHTTKEESTVTASNEPTQSKNIQNISTMTKSIVYGRDSPREISTIPHASRSKQIFFEDAPSITQARGYNGPKPQSIDYVSQKLDTFKKQQELRQESSKESSVEPVVEKISVEQTADMTVIDKSLISNSVKTEEEIIIVKEDEDFLTVTPKAHEEEIMEAVNEKPVVEQRPESRPQPEQSWQSTTRHESTIAKIPEPVVEERKVDERIPNEQPTQSAPAEKKPSQDLPKVDIFEFFKKKG